MATSIPTQNTTFENFARDGYFLVKGLYDAPELAEIQKDFDRIVSQLVASEEEINARWSGPEMERIGGETIVIHTHNVQQYSAAWTKAFMNERFLDIASQLLGPNIVLHHSKLFQKPPEKGAPFPMHQDWTYFPTEKDSMIAAVIHVSESTDEMGCLRVYPGSHKEGRIEGTSGQSESEMLARYPLEGATPMEAAPGDVLFFHYFTVHGSMPNRSLKTRKTVLVQLYSGDDQVEEGNQHPNERLVLRGFSERAKRSTANATK